MVYNYQDDKATNLSQNSRILSFNEQNNTGQQKIKFIQKSHIGKQETRFVNFSNSQPIGEINQKDLVTSPYIKTE